MYKINGKDTGYPGWFSVLVQWNQSNQILQQKPVQDFQPKKKKFIKKTGLSSGLQLKNLPKQDKNPNTEKIKNKTYSKDDLNTTFLAILAAKKSTNLSRISLPIDNAVNKSKINAISLVTMLGLKSTNNYWAI